MRITVNGEPLDIEGPLAITALLAQLNIDPRRVAVEHNLAIVKKNSYDSTVVNEGDRIEVVNFVGGGEWEMVDGKWKMEKGKGRTWIPSSLRIRRSPRA